MQECYPGWKEVNPMFVAIQTESLVPLRWTFGCGDIKNEETLGWFHMSRFLKLQQTS